jgi:8-oxo-dGTP pyrophosphatase MutT (NUDIX family)
MKESKINKNKLRKAVFGLAYCENSEGKIEYVILKRKNHWNGWEFPKGKIEWYETKRMATRREVKEETGLKVLSIKRFHVEGLYKYKKELKNRPGIIGQTYTLFAVEVERGKGNIKVDDKEHYYGEWASYKKAYKKLTWPDQKKCLKIVNEWIRKKD